MQAEDRQRHVPASAECRNRGRDLRVELVRVQRSPRSSVHELGDTHKVEQAHRRRPPRRSPAATATRRATRSFTGRRTTYRPPATAMSRIATIRKAAIAGTEEPERVGDVGGGRGRVGRHDEAREHAELGERRQHRHEQEAERSHESEPALGLVGRLAFRACDRSACHLIPREHEQRSAWMDRRLVSHRDRRRATGGGQRSQPSRFTRCLLGRSGEGLHRCRGA